MYSIYRFPGSRDIGGILAYSFLPTINHHNHRQICLKRNPGSTPSPSIFVSAPPKLELYPRLARVVSRVHSGQGRTNYHVFDDAA
jgi:hypothetical protein